MRERQQNYITLDEVALEASRLLFRSVPFTIEEQIPVFTAAASGLKNTTASRKKNYLNKRRSWLSSWLIIVTGLIYAYIGIEQVVKGNVPMGVTYMSYATANIGLYYMAK